MLLLLTSSTVPGLSVETPASRLLPAKSIWPLLNRNLSARKPSHNANFSYPSIAEVRCVQCTTLEALRREMLGRTYHQCLDVDMSEPVFLTGVRNHSKGECPRDYPARSRETLSNSFCQRDWELLHFTAGGRPLLEEIIFLVYFYGHIR
jgi:hypothetical protein